MFFNESRLFVWGKNKINDKLELSKNSVKQKTLGIFESGSGNILTYDEG